MGWCMTLEYGISGAAVAKSWGEMVRRGGRGERSLEGGWDGDRRRIGFVIWSCICAPEVGQFVVVDVARLVGLWRSAVFLVDGARVSLVLQVSLCTSCSSRASDQGFHVFITCCTQPSFLFIL